MIERDVIEDSDACGPDTKLFWCPGCGCGHYFTPDRWVWNGSRTRPTVSPSILVQYNGNDAGNDGAPPARCHFFIRDGRIEYCSDSTHALAGQSVDMQAEY